MQTSIHSAAGFEKRFNIVTVISDLLVYGLGTREANDASDEFSASFKPYLNGIFRILLLGESEANQEKLLKVLQSWADKKIYDPTVVKNTETSALAAVKLQQILPVQAIETVNRMAIGALPDKPKTVLTPPPVVPVQTVVEVQSQDKKMLDYSKEDVDKTKHSEKRKSKSHHHRHHSKHSRHHKSRSSKHKSKKKSSSSSSSSRSRSRSRSSRSSRSHSRSSKHKKHSHKRSSKKRKRASRSTSRSSSRSASHSRSRSPYKEKSKKPAESAKGTSSKSRSASSSSRSRSASRSPEPIAKSGK